MSLLRTDVGVSSVELARLVTRSDDGYFVLASTSCAVATGTSPVGSLIQVQLDHPSISLKLATRVVSRLANGSPYFAWMLQPQ